MPKLTNIFASGKMNKDIAESLMKQDEYAHAENLRFHINDGNDGIGVNIKGTTMISDATAGNTDLKCVGAYFNENKDAIYYLLASTNGVISKIVEYDINLNTTSIIAQDSTSILKFNKAGYITGINELNGLLFISEWGNNPRRINIERAKTYGLNGFTEDDISLIVKPPMQKLKLTLQTTDSILKEENNMEENFFSFSYRYRYLDGEYSVLAPFTEFAFEPKEFKYNFAEQSNKSMVNKYNQVLIEFNTGNERVTEIQLVLKESGSNTEWIIDDFNKSLMGYGHNETKSFVFNNSKVKRALSDNILPGTQDNVPRTAKAQTIIDGRLLLAHYKEFYDIVDNLGAQIEIDYSLEAVSLPNTKIVETLTVPSLLPKKTVKSNRDYEVVMVYVDEYGRFTVNLESKTNTIFIDGSKSITENSIHVLLKHKPPVWAKYYRFFIRQSKKDYEQILPTLFYEDGAYRWVKLEGADKDKVREGDYLIVKSDTSGIKSTLTKVKVLEVKSQEKNFLQPDSVIDKIKERSGLYFKIKPSGFRIDLDDYEQFLLETYDSTRKKYRNPIRSLTQEVSKAHFYGDTLNDVTVSGTYTGATDSRTRYLIEIDSLQSPSKGSVTLNSGASGSVDGITVNGVQIMSGAVIFNVDLPTTATDVAANITANTSAPNYTAIAIGDVIEITSVIQGTSTNGFAVVSTVTTITKTDVNLSGGKENTFKWSTDDGGTYIAENVEITTTPQLLNNGISITFASVIGHSILDNWNINARAVWTTLNNSRAYGFFRTDNLHSEILENEEDEIIENGARLYFEYTEYGTGSEYWVVDNISGGIYDNIQEWFYKENIIDIIAPQSGITISDIHFIRGVIYKDDTATQITQDIVDGTMTMVVRSIAHDTALGNAKVGSKSEMTQSKSDTSILFETEPKEQPKGIFYEIGKTYDITGGFHIADSTIPTDVSQTALLDLRVKLDWFNAYSYGNAVESYKIKDEFNRKGLDTGIRTSTTQKEQYKEVVREADITWSDVYNNEATFNGLSTFNLSMANFVTLDKENASIQKLHNANGDLMVFQEDAIGIMPYNKNIIYSSEGDAVVGISTNILNKDSYRPYSSGENGISLNPEGFVSVGNRKYLPHRVGGNILRLSTDGITEINENGLEYFSSKEMKANKGQAMVAGYDPKHQEYLIYLPNTGMTLGFKEKSGGFPTFYTFQPDFLLGADNELYGWKNGKMYLMNNSEIRNNFFGVQHPSKIKFFVNHHFGLKKVFKAITLQSSHPWLANIATKLTSRDIQKDSFTKIEDYWHSEIMGNTNLNILSNSIFGIGSYAIINGDIFCKKGSVMSIGDYVTSNTLTFAQNKIIDILDDRIVLENKITTAVSFLMYSKNQNIDGGDIRGDVMSVELINDSYEEVKIESVSVEVSESEVN